MVQNLDIKYSLSRSFVLSSELDMFERKLSLETILIFDKSKIYTCGCVIKQNDVKVSV